MCSCVINVGRIDAGIPRVRAKKLDVRRMKLVVHRSDQPITIDCNIENHAIACDDGRFWKLRFYLAWR